MRKGGIGALSQCLIVVSPMLLFDLNTQILTIFLAFSYAASV